MWIRKPNLRALAIVSVLALAACGDDGPGSDGPAVPAPAENTCPEATSLQVTTPDTGTFTLDVVSEFALKIEDDTLYGSYWDAAFAGFELEPARSFTTEGDQRAVTLAIYNRDLTLPGTGTFDFQGTQNTYFQPSFQTVGTDRPMTTIGDGGTLTVTVANDEELCGSLDVSDGSLTIQGVFRAPVETPA